MTSLAEAMGDRVRLVGAHEVLAWKKENRMRLDAPLTEVNAERRKAGKKPFMILPSRIRLPDR